MALQRVKPIVILNLNVFKANPTIAMAQAVLNAING